jgi:hypothetical protein
MMKGECRSNKRKLNGFENRNRHTNEVDILRKLHYLALVLAAASAGCASITDGTSQTLIVQLTPPTAVCQFTRDGVELGSVSGKQNTITVSKGAKDIIVNCKSEGYSPKTQRLVSSTQTAGVVGGIFLDLGITDMITGAMWKYPSDISIVMDKL